MQQENWGMYDVANKAFDAMQSTIGRQKIAAYPPDVEIVIARNACGTLEFERSAEMITLGYKKAVFFKIEPVKLLWVLFIGRNPSCYVVVAIEVNYRLSM